MVTNMMRFSAPRWTATRWLVTAGSRVPADIRGALLGTLYGTLPIFAGGVTNTLGVAALVTYRHPGLLFGSWLVGEVVLCTVRLLVLVTSLRAARAGRPTRTDLYIWLGVLWAASVGLGTFITIMSGDWVASTLVCLSTAAMVGGMCFRNFGAPRLVAAMIVLSMGPCVVAGLLSGQLILAFTALQIPFYLVSMSSAAFRLNAMLVATMRAERSNDRRAHRDGLTGLVNRAGLDRAFALDADRGEHIQALFYLDLDGFKAVNDAHGYAAGDMLLVAVAARLSSIAGSDDIVARVGGDEFVVLSRAEGPNAAMTRAEVWHEAVCTRPFVLPQTKTDIGVSIGVALRTEESCDLKSLLACADQALYLAKAAGGGCRMAGGIESVDTLPDDQPAVRCDDAETPTLLERVA